MVFNRNKMRILKPDFWKEHFPIQLFYRLFNHFSEFYILSSEQKFTKPNINLIKLTKLQFF